MDKVIFADLGPKTGFSCNYLKPFEKSLKPHDRSAEREKCNDICLLREHMCPFPVFACQYLLYREEVCGNIPASIDVAMVLKSAVGMTCFEEGITTSPDTGY
jgi:hypothetical protein